MSTCSGSLGTHSMPADPNVTVRGNRRSNDHESTSSLRGARGEVTDQATQTSDKGRVIQDAIDMLGKVGSGLCLKKETFADLLDQKVSGQSRPLQTGAKPSDSARSCHLKVRRAAESVVVGQAGGMAEPLLVSSVSLGGGVALNLQQLKTSMTKDCSKESDNGMPPITRGKHSPVSALSSHPVGSDMIEETSTTSVAQSVHTPPRASSPAESSGSSDRNDCSLPPLAGALGPSAGEKRSPEPTDKLLSTADTTAHSDVTTVDQAGQIRLVQSGAAIDSKEGDLAIRMSLPNLGFVEVRVGKNDSHQATTISAERADTLRTLMTDDAQLRTILNNSGVDHSRQSIQYTLMPSASSANDVPPSLSPDEGSRQREPKHPGHEDADDEEVFSSTTCVVTAGSNVHAKQLLGMIDITA